MRFDFLCFIFLLSVACSADPLARANVSATSAKVIAVNAVNRLAKSPVSEYLAINDVEYHDQDNTAVNALNRVGIRYMRMNGRIGSLIPVTRMGDSITLDFKEYDRHLQALRTRLQVKPLVVLAYMARAISSRPGETDYWAYPPANWDHWHDVVHRLVRHHVEKNLAGLYYEVWNEPESDHDWKGTYDEYVTLYTVTARAVRAADPSAKIGGPAPSSWTIPWMGRSARTHTAPFITDFLASIKQYNMNNPDSPVPMDFVSWHHYSTDYLSVGYDEVRRYVLQAGFPGSPEYLVTEWNSEYGSSTHSWPFKASFAVANIIQQIKLRQLWPFWFTFRLQQSQEFPTDYKSGLIANNDVSCKRATYAAFQMLHAMTKGHLVSTSSPPELPVLATRDDQASTVIAVVANYSPKSQSAAVSFTRLPFTTSSLNRKMQWIDNARSMGCDGLEAGTIDQVSVSNNSLRFTLDFLPYSVAQITLTPKP